MWQRRWQQLACSDAMRCEVWSGGTRQAGRKKIPNLLLSVMQPGRGCQDTVQQLVGAVWANYLTDDVSAPRQDRCARPRQRCTAPWAPTTRPCLLPSLFVFWVCVPTDTPVQLRHYVHHAIPSLVSAFFKNFIHIFSKIFSNNCPPNTTTGANTHKNKARSNKIPPTVGTPCKAKKMRKKYVFFLLAFLNNNGFKFFGFQFLFFFIIN